MERGEIVRELALALRARRDEAAAIVAEETGKALELALGEADAAVEMNETIRPATPTGRRVTSTVRFGIAEVVVRP